MRAHTHTADQFLPSCAAAVTFALHSTEISELKHCTIQYVTVICISSGTENTEILFAVDIK